MTLDNYERTDQRETKDIATKALTVADTTKKEVQPLAQRVSALEKGGGGHATRSGGATGSGQNTTEPMGYKTLGGDAGTDMVVGEFDEYASREERKNRWEQIKRSLPEEIIAQFAREEAPGLRNRVMIISIKESPEGPAKTRENLLNICRRIKQAKLKYTDTDGVMRAVYANPTKPLAVRQRDAQVTLKADSLRQALGEEKGGQVELELGKGRIFLGKEILAQRTSPSGDMAYQWPTLNKHLPDTTPDDMAKIEKEVAAARAAKRSP